MVRNTGRKLEDTSSPQEAPEGTRKKDNYAVFTEDLSVEILLQISRGTWRNCVCLTLSLLQNRPVEDPLEEMYVNMKPKRFKRSGANSFLLDCQMNYRT